MRRQFDWIILNQTLAPTDQKMLQELSELVGDGLLLTGTPFPGNARKLKVQKMPSYRRGKLVRRAISWLNYIARAVPILCTQGGRPFVLAVTNPPFNVHLALIFAHARNFPFGLLIWDIYPDALVKLNWMKSENPAARAWRSLNAIAMLEARVVITLGENMKRLLANQIGRKADRVRWEVIPNWVDTSVFRPYEPLENAFRREQGWVGGITVLYSGNIGAGHGVEALPAAAQLLVDRHDIRFAVVGDGLGRSALEHEVDTRNLPRFTLHPYQNWERVPEVTAAGDIAVVFQRPGLEDLAVPSKTYSAMAAGSAILAVTRETSDLTALVRKYGVGEVVSATPQAIADGILRIVSNPQAFEDMRRRARKVAVEKFDTRVVRRQWEAVLAPLVPPMPKEAKVI